MFGFKSSKTSAANKHTTAIILAGGSGSRMKSGNITKQMISIEGVPIICRTVEVFEKSDLIKDIIIVAKEDEIGIYDEFIKKYNWKKIKAVVGGGQTRQDSLFNGIKILSEDCEYVAIHDGARCFVTGEIIEKVLIEAIKYKSAIAAERSSDTIKHATRDGFIFKTLDRDDIWRATTPQIFKSEVIITAVYYAKDKGFTGTDDASLVENAGMRVKLVDCGHNNIKITYKEDLEVAEKILGKDELK